MIAIVLCTLEGIQKRNQVKIVRQETGQVIFLMYKLIMGQKVFQHCAYMLYLISIVKVFVLYLGCDSDARFIPSCF